MTYGTPVNLSQTNNFDMQNEMTPPDNIPLSDEQKNYLLLLAYIYLKNNQLDKATTVYKALWYLYPESESITLSLSYLYLSTQQFETALFYADTYLEKKDSALAFLLKGQALMMLGRNFEAREAIKNFLT